MLTREEQKEIMRHVARISICALRAGAALERDRQINKPRDRDRTKALERARSELRDYLKEVG
jgi:hypothetical protein